MARPVLILGGTGVFGRRLARHLIATGDIALVVSSRQAAKAEALAADLNETRPAVPVQGIALDHRRNLSAQMDRIKPFVVVDCSGPFQCAGYDTARAVIRSGAHFIDLADARDYLAGFTPALDQLARAHGVTALTGASSTPTLSTCVADRLTDGWRRVDAIDICITPGGRSEVGQSVIAAILSYAGKDIPTWRLGRLSRTTGWAGARYVEVPGLGLRRVAPVETLDAEFLGPRCNVRSRVSFSAGLESRLEQRGIEWMAALRRRGLLPRISRLIPALLRARKITRLVTSDRGGMLVDARGLDAQGRFTRARWSLIARQDHGPFVPILPAAAAIRQLLRGALPAGAFLTHPALGLEEIEAEAAAHDISTTTQVKHITRGLFEDRFGRAGFDALPKALQRFHRQSAPPLWSGRADITGGRWGLPRLIARAFGFPRPGQTIPVTVQVDRGQCAQGNPVERWTRHFGDQELTSVLTGGRGGPIIESFPPFAFELDVTAGKESIAMPIGGWKLGRFRLPRFLAPVSHTLECEDDEGRFRFDVKLTLPCIGLLAHYRGWLTPDTARASCASAERA